MAVVGGTMLFGNDDGSLYCLELKSGKDLWHHKNAHPITAAPAVSQGQVVFVDLGGEAAALDLESGAEMWRRPFGSGENEFAPVIVGDMAILVSPTSLQAVRLSDGAALWTQAVELYDGQPAWKRRTPALTGMAGVAVSGGCLFYAEQNGQVVARRLSDGETLWRTQLRSDVYVAPSVCGEQVLVGTAGGELACLEAETGESAWTLLLSEAILTPPVVAAGGRILVATANECLYCLEADA